MTRIHEQNAIEAIKPDAVEYMVGEARRLTIAAIEKIYLSLKEGISEQEAIQNANKIMADMGAKKFWHRTHVRFGQSTVLGFSDPYEPEVRLKHHDMVYIDIAPVWNGIEGDCGQSFVFGIDEEKAKMVEAVNQIFEDLRDAWKRNKLTGAALLEQAKQLAEAKGYILAPSYVKGHRLSEFPHAAYTKDPLFEMDFCPSDKRWVLEVQICNKEKTYGAFFEDLLLLDA